MVTRVVPWDSKHSFSTARILQLLKTRRVASLEETLQTVCIASGLAEEAEECQVNTLLYCLRDNAEDVLHSTNILEEDRKKYGKVLENFIQL